MLPFLLSLFFYVASFCTCYNKISNNLKIFSTFIILFVLSELLSESFVDDVAEATIFLGFWLKWCLWKIWDNLTQQWVCREKGKKTRSKRDEEEEKEWCLSSSSSCQHCKRRERVCAYGNNDEDREKDSQIGDKNRAK